MRLLLAPTFVIALASSAAAQFTSAQRLVLHDDARAVPEIPAAGLWTSQLYIGAGNEYIRPVDGGYLDKVEHHFVRWDESERAYRGLLGGNESYRVLPLGGARILVERDLVGGADTYVRIAEWSGAELHLFDLDLDPGSAFVRHLERAGASLQTVEGGFFGPSRKVHGDRERLVEALRTWTFGPHDQSERVRRPKREEMTYVWNYFELELWVERQKSILTQIEQADGRLQRLGELHLARSMARDACNHRLRDFAPFELETFAFGSMYESAFEAHADRAERVLERLDARIEKRREWIATQVEVLRHDLEENEGGWGRSTCWPGQPLEFHVVVKRADGVVLMDTRAQGEPMTRPVMGDLPEGVQYALCTMAIEDVLELRIPPALAFGTEHGTVDVELEVLRSLAQATWKPPLEGILGYRIAPVDATEAPSGLRYRDLVPGDGPRPTLGQTVQLRLLSWNVAGDVLEEAHVVEVELGSDALMPGVNEGVASMQLGGERLLFLPRHLADQTPARRGMAQCVVVGLMRIGPEGTSPGAPR